MYFLTIFIHSTSHQTPTKNTIFLPTMTFSRLLNIAVTVVFYTTFLQATNLALSIFSIHKVQDLQYISLSLYFPFSL